MSENQDPQFSNDAPEPDMSFKDALQLVADQLNEAPRRKLSLSFLNFWFLGHKDVLVALLNAAFFGIPVFFFALGKVLGYKPFEPTDLWWVLICLLFGVLGLAFFTPYWKAVFLFKNGYFTLGYVSERGIVYKDSAGNKHYWIPSQFYKIGQPFIDCIHRPDEPYLVVVGKNPNNFLVMDSFPYLGKGDLAAFSIFMGFYTIYAIYDLNNKTFFGSSIRMWRWIIPVGIVLWSILWFGAVFFPVN